MNLRQLDLNLLLVFNAVYETGGNTKAGKKLGLTQSAVSNAIRRLREHLGDPLFERRGADYVPTPTAHRLAPVVRDALKSLEQSLQPDQVFDPTSSERRFSIIMPDPCEITVLTPMIRKISEHGWGVGLDAIPLLGAQPVRDLLERKYDLAILPNAVLEDNISSAYLFDEDPVYIVRRDHPLLSDRDVLSKEDMARIGLVALPDELRRQTHLEHELRAKQVKRRHVATVTRLWSVPNIVASTDLAGAVTESMAAAMADRFDLRVLPMPTTRPTHNWHLLWREDAAADPALAWLIRQITGLFGKDQGEV